MTNTIERLARLGYVAIGIVYAIIGLFAAAAGIGIGGKAADKNDAFTFILRQPFGKFILIVLSAGLVGYALWRLISGVHDSEGSGNDAKGLTLRANSMLRGLGYGWLAFEVVRFAMRRGEVTESDSTARHWTARALEKPFGSWLVAAAGLYIFGYGIYQIYRAWKGKLGKQVAIPPGALTKISRFGIAGRAVVFLVVGASLVFAALNRNPGEARGTSGALRELASQPFGFALLAVVGIALVAYGVYCFLNAKYRRITT